MGRSFRQKEGASITAAELAQIRKEATKMIGGVMEVLRVCESLESGEGGARGAGKPSLKVFEAEEKK